MNVKCELNKTGSGVKVPNSYAVASTTSDKLPGELLHGKDIVPREIRYDLYQKIKTARDRLGLNCKHLETINQCLDNITKKNVITK